MNQNTKVLKTYGAAILIVAYDEWSTISISRYEKYWDHCKVTARLFENRGIERIVLQEFGGCLEKKDPT